MNPTEIKKVLDAFFYDPENDGIFKHIDDDDYIYRRDAFISLHAEPDNSLHHLFGSPLSQIEDMVEGLKTKMEKKQLIEDLKELERLIIRVFKWDETNFGVETISQAITALSTPPLAAMPSECIGFVEWILNQPYFYKPPFKGLWYHEDNLEATLTTAELYQQFLNDKK